MHIGYKIKKIREIKNISQEYMAEQLGITQSAYSLIESGKANISRERLHKIAEILEVSPEDIEHFCTSVYFQHSPQSGYYNTYHHQNNLTEKLLQALLEELQQSREERRLMMEWIKKFLENEK